jgi:F0F1-type ATP synthase beta subunit
MIQKTKEILQSYADIDDIVSVYNIDSSDLTPDKRNILTRKIKTIEQEDPTKYS